MRNFKVVKAYPKKCLAVGEGLLVDGKALMNSAGYRSRLREWIIATRNLVNGSEQLNKQDPDIPGITKGIIFSAFLLRSSPRYGTITSVAVRNSHNIQISKLLYTSMRLYT